MCRYTPSLRRSHWIISPTHRFARSVVMYEGTSEYNITITTCNISLITTINIARQIEMTEITHFLDHKDTIKEN